MNILGLIEYGLIYANDPPPFRVGASVIAIIKDVTNEIVKQVGGHGFLEVQSQSETRPSPNGETCTARLHLIFVAIRSVLAPTLLYLPHSDLEPVG